MNISKALILVAVICFILAAFDVGLDRISIGWAGLAFLAASFFD